MTKLFIDSDVILDLLGNRQEYKSASQLFRHIENQTAPLQGYTTPIIFANVHYILSKQLDKKTAKEKLAKLRLLLSMVSVSEQVIDTALANDYKDFEDSLQFLTAEKHQLDVIITRNKKDFSDSSLPVMTAKEFLAIL